MEGKLYLVSVGPGFSELIPPLAKKAIAESDAIVGYDLYLRWIREWVEAKEIYTLPLTQERERALKSIELVRSGKRVSLISSGDIGVYAMATLAFDLMGENENFQVEVIPGITAANACASLMGAPLSHDFATLSLSDLLCPWEWIEKRASHIAQADLAVVFYNVQSRARQEGVYQILRIMLKFKLPGTWCGIVRNAYREDQKIQFFTLEELLQQQFDMLTTIIIGNRFTRRRGKFLYTPRGYEGWKDSEKVLEKTSLPVNACWVFSGTSDGNQLASEIHAQGKKVVLSASSEYGRALAQKKYPEIAVTGGRKGAERRRQELRESSAASIVDATHPFAEEISKQLIQISKELDIPYLRYERPGLGDNASPFLCATMESAAELAIQKGNRIFLSTGSKDLETFLRASENQTKHWFVRITPEPSILERAIELGIPRDHICAMQGPFSQAFNEALWRDWQIDCVVTKDSGEAGGYSAKANAARALEIPLITVQRPSLDYPRFFSKSSQVLDWLEDSNSIPH
ncbi:MAG: precorrin-3B C(17)-methyltransferase [SAR324 cluster bacterium]|nr:precorrin-3B C(17)-methyltransferase [SAR324 cluster bacterium]